MQIMSRYLFDGDEILCAAAARVFLASGALAIAKWEGGLSDDQVRFKNFTSHPPCSLRPT